MGTVSKSLKLLDHFTSQRQEIGLTELARMSGLNKATALRLIRELESVGFVEQLPASRAYRLGPGVLRLAALREASVPLQKLAVPILKDLTTLTGETAHLGVMQADRLVPYLHAYSSRHATQVIMDDIDLLDFHATGSGLAVLAFSSDAFIGDVLAQPLKRYTPNTMTDAADVLATLGTIKQSGYAESIGGVEHDVHSFATPFFDAQSNPVGSITVVGPTSRMSPETGLQISKEVMSAGLALTMGLGGVFPNAFPVAT